MNELITSIASGLEFPKYVNRIIYDFEAKKFNKTNRDFEPDGFNLIFPIRNLSCNYSLEFENDCFLLKLNFEIDDEKYPYLRSEFCKNFNFLIIDESFDHQNKTSIVLKSKINAELIERAQIIFVTERWMRTYFFPETKIALDEMVSIVFEEFKETMHQIWKTVFENFETVDFSKLTQLTKDISNDDLIDTKEQNPFNLPPIIKIYFDACQQQKSEKMSIEQIIPRKKKNWLRRIYIFMKKD